LLPVLFNFELVDVCLQIPGLAEFGTNLANQTRLFRAQLEQVLGFMEKNVFLLIEFEFHIIHVFFRFKMLSYCQLVG